MINNTIEKLLKNKGRKRREERMKKQRGKNILFSGYQINYPGAVKNKEVGDLCYIWARMFKVNPSFVSFGFFTLLFRSLSLSLFFFPIWIVMLLEKLLASAMCDIVLISTCYHCCSSRGCFYVLFYHYATS